MTENQLQVKQLIDEIGSNDPTVLKVLAAEYYFLNKDLEKAKEIFAEAYLDPDLSAIMKETVRNYLIVSSRELRKKELIKLDFNIQFTVEGKTITITRETFRENIDNVGELLELLDYHLKIDQGR